MARTMSQRQASRLVLYAVLVLSFFGILLLSPRLFASHPHPASPLEVSTHIEAIRNETLGVKRVFAINLPSRADKRDNIVLGASVNGFRVDFVDATTPDETDPKTYPYNWNFDHRPVEYAARRSHLNVIQRIVRERLSSAIVMEDDADWDVTLKTQLQTFAIAVRSLQDSEQRVTESPYGDDWDILWLGHCGVECRPDHRYFLTPNDPTIPPPNHFLPYWRDPPPLDRPDDSRLTCAISDGVCSIVYAVSFHGAQRILAALSVNPTGIAEQVDIGAQFDVSLGRLCGAGYLRCFAPYPSLTGGYKAAGSAAKGSDINGPDGEEGGFEPPFSHGVMYSTMVNINRLLAGEKTVLSIWDDVSVREIFPGDVSVMEGTLMVPQAKP